MFNFQRVIVGLFLLIVLMALFVPATTYAANDANSGTVIVAAEAEEEEENTGAGLVIIMAGLGAVGTVGFYYWLRQRDASKNSNNE